MIAFSSPPDVSDAALVAARDGAVACDLDSLHVLAIAGPDATAFLQGQVSIDVARLASNACRYASFNSPKGRVLANFVLWKDPAVADTFMLLLPGELAQPIKKRFSMYVLRSKDTVNEVSERTLRTGVGGPLGGDVVRRALGGPPAAFQTMTTGDLTVLGLPGPRFVVIAAAEGAGAVRSELLEAADQAPYGVWQWLTIRAGVPIVTAPTQELFVAQTLNLDILDGIDFQKGCYTGQEIIARTQYLGRLKERTLPFHVDASAVTPGTRLWSPAFADQPCGTVVNAAVAPGGGSDLLAALQLAAAESGNVRLGAPDGPPLAALPPPYALPAALSESRGTTA